MHFENQRSVYPGLVNKLFRLLFKLEIVLNEKGTSSFELVPRPVAEYLKCANSLPSNATHSNVSGLLNLLCFKCFMRASFFSKQQKLNEGKMYNSKIKINVSN